MPPSFMVFWSSSERIRGALVSGSTVSGKTASWQRTKLRGTIWALVGSNFSDKTSRDTVADDASKKQTPRRNFFDVRASDFKEIISVST